MGVNTDESEEDEDAELFNSEEERKEHADREIREQERAEREKNIAQQLTMFAMQNCKCYIFFGGQKLLSDDPKLVFSKDSTRVERFFWMILYYFLYDQ